MSNDSTKMLDIYTNEYEVEIFIPINDKLAINDVMRFKAMSTTDALETVKESLEDLLSSVSKEYHILSVKRCMKSATQLNTEAVLKHEAEMFKNQIR